MCAFQENREPLRIYLTHSPEMSPEVSFGDEIAKYGLFKQRCVAARHRDCCGHVIHHVGRNHQVPQPQRREENFAEASREEHQPAAVESLQSRHWTSRIAILTVVIVFKSEEHTSELQSLRHLVCRLLL